ncbi:MAG: hypothetical protein KDC80_20490 [Saprospiraceae bacterium]|nr:hypothetical protein [Saprospiraceae bacterium]
MIFTKSLKKSLFICLLVLFSAITYGQSRSKARTSRQSTAKENVTTKEAPASGESKTETVDPRQPAFGNSTGTVYQRNSQSKLASDVRRHFGSMKYGGVNYLRNSRSSYTAVKGAGKVAIKGGRAVSYKFLILSDGKGDIGGVYIGTSNAPTSWNMTMTHDAANQNLARCKKKFHPNSDRYKTCINNLVSKAISDCMLSSFGAADCADHCWYNESLCDQ